MPSRYGPLLRGIAHWSQLPCYRNSGHKVKIQLAVAAYVREPLDCTKKNKSGYLSSSSSSSSSIVLLAVMHGQHPAVNLLACRRYIHPCVRHEDGSSKLTGACNRRLNDLATNDPVIKRTGFWTIYRCFGITHEKI